MFVSSNDLQGDFNGFPVIPGIFDDIYFVETVEFPEFSEFSLMVIPALDTFILHIGFYFS